MKTSLRPSSVLFVSASSLLLASSASADVVGRLHVVVKDGDTEKPVSGATVTLHDSAGVRGDITLTTGATGDVTTDPLENHGFHVTTKASGYENDDQNAVVAADSITEVDVELNPVEKTINITGQKNLVQKTKTVESTTRNQNFIQTYPVANGNSQSLNGLIMTAPGFVQDSNNQVHPSGEHSSTTTMIDGVALGGAFQGKFGPLIVPDSISNIDIMTGSYAPEYGGETAAILSTTIKAGTVKPEYGVDLGGGSYDEKDGSILVGGQLGAASGPEDEDGDQAHKIWYFLNSTTRSTDNALETPQPDDQTAHNHGQAESYLGRFDYVPDSNNQVTMTLDDALGNTEIAQRTGLDDSFAPYGQGYGFGGFRDANGYVPGFTTYNPAIPGSGQILLPNQANASQGGETGVDINQQDENTFDILQYRHNFNNSLTGMLSAGSNTSELDTTNGNGAAPAVLPDDSAYEFNPTVNRKSTHGQFSGSLTKDVGKHSFKAGFSDDEQTGDESYNLTPDSIEALDALEALQNMSNNGVILAPAATKVAGETDVNGNPVYTPTGNVNTTTPTLFVHRSGYYRAGYLQDTYKISTKATANYGVRLDGYDQTVSASSSAGGSTAPTNIKTYDLSPRANFSYALKPTLIGRLSYNRLFTQPPIAQSAILGQTIQPQLSNMYEGSLEKQVRDNQTFKLTGYYKHSTHQIDTSLLIPATQLGIYTAVNFDEDDVRALELSYNLTPHHNVGMSSFVSYTYSMAKPDGLDNTGAPVPQYNDHDQRDTVDSGIAYNFLHGSSLSANYYWGSGVTSSEIYVGGPRTSRDHLDLAASTGNRLFDGKGGLKLEADNVFNNTALINFNSGFSGTRFQTGRSITVSAFARF